MHLMLVLWFGSAQIVAAASYLVYILICIYDKNASAEGDVFTMSHSWARAEECIYGLALLCPILFILHLVVMFSRLEHMTSPRFSNCQTAALWGFPYSAITITINALYAANYITSFTYNMCWAATSLLFFWLCFVARSPSYRGYSACSVRELPLHVKPTEFRKSL